MKILKKVIKRLMYSGNDFTCPICQERVRKFYWIGRENAFFNSLGGVLGAGRRRGGCMSCNSTDKERFLYIYLNNNIFDRLRKIEGMSVLHFGPEKPIKRLLENFEKIDYKPVDYFAEGYNYDNDVKSMDVQKILLSDGSVDLLICCHVLEHVNDVGTALKEIYRVLKPGGTAILQVPLATNLRKTIELDLIIRNETINELIYGQADHLRLFGLDYLDMLNDVGFEITKYKYDGQQDYGISLNDYLIIASK